MDLMVLGAYVLCVVWFVAAVGAAFLVVRAEVLTGRQRRLLREQRRRALAEGAVAGEQWPRWQPVEPHAAPRRNGARW